MPLYTYQCPRCEREKDEIRSVAERNNAPTCECGIAMQKIIASSRVVGDVEPYYDDNLESYVKSKQHRRALMKERGVYEKYGKGWI